MQQMSHSQREFIYSRQLFNIMFKTLKQCSLFMIYGFNVFDVDNSLICMKFFYIKHSYVFFCQINEYLL